MGVNVDEAGEQVQAASVELARSAKAIPHLGDPAGGDAHIHNPVQPGAGIEYVGTPDNEVFLQNTAVQAATSRRAPVARVRTAERTATPEAT